ncbi:hypothetical protein [uncultured Campylobacter sp.]|uniref:hypothetical protein n=1 Tax=uncultured Campylobacter sp. TaxID=218934 RepID=UPI00261E9414|nr:hypothetical protein [uncultured Campylobacter sp.]
MKIDSSNIYIQNLAELNSAKTTRKENNESFDVVLENETKTDTIKIEDIKNGSVLTEYVVGKARNNLGLERYVGVLSFSVAASFIVGLESAIKDNPELSINDNDIIIRAMEKRRENYKSPDDLKQDIVNMISAMQNNIPYVPGTESKEEFEAEKKETINILTQIYKELFNEEPVVPEFETLGEESSIDISAAIKEFLSKPYEKEEDVLKFIKDLDKQNQEEPSVEILGIKERIYKQNEKLKSENLNLLLQNI